MHVYVCTLHSQSMCLYLCLCVFSLRLVDSDFAAPARSLGTFLEAFLVEVLPSTRDVTSPNPTTPKGEGGTVRGAAVRCGSGQVTTWVMVVTYSKAKLAYSPVVAQLFIFCGFLTRCVCVGMNAQ